MNARGFIGTLLAYSSLACVPVHAESRGFLPVLLTFSLLASVPVHADSTVVIVQGLGGNETYSEQFTAQVDALADAVATLSPAPVTRVFRGDEAQREPILEHLAALADTVAEDDQLFVYLIGHGSYDEEEYKFNVAGPDLTDADLKTALDAIPTSNQVVVNTSSASGAAADVWQSDERVVITATRSGSERHATRFGEHFAASLNDPAADIDKNRIVTAQEAFNFADRRVSDYFESNGSLPTEHARLDGDRAARFSLARLQEDRADPTVADTLANDPLLEELTTERDDITAKIETLRLSRDTMPPDQYRSKLLAVMLELAEAEDAIEQREAELEEQ